jgi:hypothetical protein
MEIVIRWQKTYIPHSVFGDVASFIEAAKIVDKAVAEHGAAIDINVFENHRCIASLRTVR